MWLLLMYLRLWNEVWLGRLHPWLRYCCKYLLAQWLLEMPTSPSQSLMTPEAASTPESTPTTIVPECISGKRSGLVSYLGSDRCLRRLLIHVVFRLDGELCCALVDRTRDSQIRISTHRAIASK